MNSMQLTMCKRISLFAATILLMGTANLEAGQTHVDCGGSWHSNDGIKCIGSIINYAQFDMEVQSPAQAHQCYGGGPSPLNGCILPQTWCSEQCCILTTGVPNGQSFPIDVVVAGIITAFAACNPSGYLQQASFPSVYDASSEIKLQFEYNPDISSTGGGQLSLDSILSNGRAIGSAPDAVQEQIESRFNMVSQGYGWIVQATATTSAMVYMAIPNSEYFVSAVLPSSLAQSGITNRQLGNGIMSISAAITGALQTSASGFAGAMVSIGGVPNSLAFSLAFVPQQVQQYAVNPGGLLPSTVLGMLRAALSLSVNTCINNPEAFITWTTNTFVRQSMVFGINKFVESEAIHNVADWQSRCANGEPTARVGSMVYSFEVP